MKIIILTTTIKVPDNLGPVCRSILHYLKQCKSQDEVTFLIIGDKIERDIEQMIESECSRVDTECFGDMSVVKYLNYENQKHYFEEYPLLENIIFDRSIQRRNIGILEAIKSGCDILISIDDDNFPINERWLYDFVNHGNNDSLIIDNNSSWIDVPYYMTGIPSRGFPILPKASKDRFTVLKEDSKAKTRKIVCHQGFISGEPDRNALHRYCYPEMSASINAFPNHNLVISNKWCVFNTQNTLFTKDLIPLLFLFPMKKFLGNGYIVDRYDDIFMSYIINKISHRFDWSISFGPPVLNQRRNDHDTCSEVFTEITGAIIAEPLLRFLENVDLESNTPLKCYEEIALKLSDFSSAKDDPVFSYLKSMSQDMVIWLSVGVVSDLISKLKSKS
jgi:hypothetical protein